MGVIASPSAATRRWIIVQGEGGVLTWEGVARFLTAGRWFRLVSEQALTLWGMPMSQLGVRIRRIEFSNFKAFGGFSLSLGEVNILVGPNNSGKSTIVGALRTLEAAVRFSRTRPPTRVHIGDTAQIGYRIPEESVPISLENVQTD